MRDWFKISTLEERGFWALHLLLLVLLVIKVIAAQHIHPPKHSQAFYDSINELLNPPETTSIMPSKTGVDKAEPKSIASFIAPEKKSSRTKIVDPNTASVEDLVAIGLKQFQAERLVKFRNSGARFFSREDMEKVYGLSSENLDRLIPYLKFPERIQNESKEHVSELELPSRVDLNLADSAQLTQLKGVGPYFARKIISYRKRLGGFKSISQLLEIKNIDSLILQNNSGVIFVDEKFSLVTIDLNSVTLKDLAAHPYMSYKKAQAIIRYREQHGPFLAIKQITNSVLIDEDDLAKIAPYLRIGGREDKERN